MSSFPETLSPDPCQYRGIGEELCLSTKVISEAAIFPRNADRDGSRCRIVLDKWSRFRNQDAGILI